jgi:hypothetical protein
MAVICYYKAAEMNVFKGSFSEQMSQARCLCDAEERMKVYFSCNSIHFGRLSKEVASTAPLQQETVANLV